jgi:phosphate transport system substrate-binding protein
MIATGNIQARHVGRLLPAALAMLSAAAILSQAMADPLIVQGSTTFNRRIMEPHEAAIEAASGQEITVIPNRTMLGIIAVMEGRAHIGMLSASLESELAKLKLAMPGLPFERLQSFEIARTRVAFVLHPSNSVRKASLDRVKKILTGEITNWRELGGKDAPIRMVIVGGGGVVITTVESELLKGQPVRGPNIIWVRTALQLIQIVEQEPNALGIAQLSLARRKGLPEIVTDKPVEQVLSLITLGEPTPAMQAVIDAARQVAEKTM